MRLIIVVIRYFIFLVNKTRILQDSLLFNYSAEYIYTYSTEKSIHMIKKRRLSVWVCVQTLVCVLSQYIFPGFVYFGTNNNGQPQLICDGHVFHVNRRTDNRIFWVCGQMRTHKCRARCITTEEGLVKRTTTEHTHPVEPMKKERTRHKKKWH